MSSAPRILPSVVRTLCFAALGALCMSFAAAAPLASGPFPRVIDSGWQMQDIAKAQESGAVVSRPGFAPQGWFRAVVPGTVLTTLVANGVYPEPLYGENNRPDRIPESLCRTAYWYRTEAEVPREYKGRRVWLNFDGINYTAEVWVNGSRMGDIRGAFARGTFDVTRVVRPGERAAIAVLIQPPPHPSTPHEQTIAGGVGPNGGEFSKDGPTFICTQGWDWIPGIRDRNMGIWQKVFFSSTGEVRLEDPLVTSDLPLPQTDVADLTVEATLRNLGDATQEAQFAGYYHNEKGERIDFSTKVTLAPGKAQRVRLTPENAPALRVQNPKLWWPNGYGDPHLYAVALRVEAAGSISDVHHLNVGIREITYALPGSENLALSVNGVPVMCRGGNWGMDEAMKRIPRERLEAQIRFHQLARCNMIRNWVGQSTGEDFYDLCDRYGILVWDEFFQPNPSDNGRKDPKDGSEDVYDVDLYLANAREKVLRFRNHPSIALWCGRNEGDPAPERLARGLQQLMAELEPVRLYHPNSADGRGVHSGGPYYWRTPREYFLPPVYAWSKGAVSKDPADLEPFKTELGSVSVPTLEAVQAMLDPKDWNTVNDAWAQHDLAKGAQAGDKFPETLTQRYGPWQGLVQFVRASQLACYESHQAMFEGRFARLFTPCAGVLAWMSNPAQPSFVWQFYSYDLEPLAALYAVKKASEPIHLQLNRNDDHLTVVNHTPAAISELTARVRVINLDGSTAADRSVHVATGGSQSSDLGVLEYPDKASPVHFVKLELRDASGRLVSENFYWRGAKETPDDLRALNTLPVVKLATKVVRQDRGEECRLQVTLTNRSNTVALLSHLQLRGKKSGKRVLPVFYDENYVSLLPGESRTLTVTAAKKDLKGDAPALVVDGWNVTAEATESGGVSVGPNPGMRG